MDRDAEVIAHFYPGSCLYPPRWRWPQRHDVIRWAPDGSEIFFSRDNVMLGLSIYAVAADGSQLRQVRGTAPGGRADLGVVTSFDVAPDGTSLVYATCEYTTKGPGVIRWHDLARVNVDGSQATRLTDAKEFESLPVWSPDGTRIAYLAIWWVPGERVGRVGLRVMTADGATVDEVYNGAVGAVFHPPSWSPDGKRLAFVTINGGALGVAWGDDPSLEFTGYVIRTVAADGSDGKTLTPTVSGPSWSPDGSRIAFAKPDGNGVALFTMAADGSDLRRVAPIEHWFEYGPRSASRAVGRSLFRGWVPTVAWSPTGEHILLVDGRHVRVVTPDGAEVDYWLIGFDGTPPIAAWSPGFDGGPVAAWSPDGSRIAIAAPMDASFSEFYNSFFRFEVVVTMAPDGRDVVPLVRMGLRDYADPEGPEGFRDPGEREIPVAVQSARYRADWVIKACAAGFVVKDPVANAGLVQDCETLAGLRDALFGLRVVNWTADTAIRDWAGVSVDGTPPRVTGLSSATIHKAYAVFDTFPQIFRSWTTIPPALGRLTELKTLDMSGTTLRGTIPPELGRLSKLEYLDLSHNAQSGLWGELPKELGNLTKLQVLNLADNQFEGPIPLELGQLHNLTTLYLSENQLTGCIPPALQKVSTNDLRKLRLPDCEAAP